ncbi:MAG: Ig-like domain-containing protein [Pirellulaceae bacterium]
MRNKTYKMSGRMETLEDRRLLSSDGILGSSAHWSFSFAPDGTDVAGHPSSLNQTFDGFSVEAWQDAIIRGFQTWAEQTNADVAVVSDSGDPFGAGGLRSGDKRFGDIRIGAAPLAENVMAISISHDAVVSGTWNGDVIFNSEINYDSLDDVFAVALHEAGHVFGLEHSDDPNSPMHLHGITPATELTATDIQQLQRRFGQRAPDANEGAKGNDSFDNATRLQKASYRGGSQGSAPSVVFGDIQDIADVDVFELDLPSGYGGPVTVELRTHGLSQLDGHFELFDEDEDAMEVTSTVNAAGNLQIQFEVAERDKGYFVAVSADPNSEYHSGGYAIVATYDHLLQAAQADIDLVTSHPYRFSDPGQLRYFFQDGIEPLTVDDLHADDTLAAAEELKTSAGFLDGVRYRTNGSISDLTDVDSYLVRSPKSLTGTMQVTVGSLQQDGLIPKLAIYDRFGAPIGTEILINGHGQVVLQATQTTADTDYFIQVAGDTSVAQHATGDYILTASFDALPTSNEVFASGSLDAEISKFAHVLYVAEPQVFHFGLHAGSVAGTNIEGIGLSIAGTPIQVLVPPGATRTATGTLLQPGAYLVEVSLLGESAPAGGESVDFEIFGQTASDPFGIKPLNPLTQPDYQCSGAAGSYCYPDGTNSSTSFYWTIYGKLDGSIVQFGDASSLTTNWWSTSTSGTSFVPSVAADNYVVPANGQLRITAQDGVLANDVGQGEIAANLVEGPSHGQLEWNTDGSFVYTPDRGFVGTDQFRYQAVAGGRLSAAGVVTVLVEVVAVDVVGDANHDGVFDSADLIQIFQFGHYEDSIIGNSTWDSGDWNGDGEFDSADLVAAFQAGTYLGEKTHIIWSVWHFA